MNRVKIPEFIGVRIRDIRRQEADPLSRKDLQKFLRHAGAFSGGPPGLSSRKGFSTK